MKILLHYVQFLFFDVDYKKNVVETISFWATKIVNRWTENISESETFLRKGPEI